MGFNNPVYLLQAPILFLAVGLGMDIKGVLEGREGCYGPVEGWDIHFVNSLGPSGT
jgi:hypothetical protein